MSDVVPFQALSPDEVQSLMRLAWTIDVFREMNPKMPTSYIAAFLAVAIRPGQGPTEHAKTLGTIQPIASRLLLEIGPQARERDEGGMELVVRQISFESRRQTEYTLSPKGLKIARQIARMLSQGRKRGG